MQNVVYLEKKRNLSQEDLNFAMLRAAGAGDYEKLKDLIVEGADIGFMNYSSLFHASLFGNDESFKIILNQIIKNCSNPYWVIVKHFWSLKGRHKNCIVKLIRKSAKTTQSRLNTELIVQCLKGNIHNSINLIKKGAHISACDYVAVKAFMTKPDICESSVMMLLQYVKNSNWGEGFPCFLNMIEDVNPKYRNLIRKLILGVE